MQSTALAIIHMQPAKMPSGRRLASHMDQISGISFDILKTFEQGDAVIAELAVNYHLTNGTTTTLPCLDIFRFNGPKVSAMLVFMDASPLFAQ